MTTLNPNEQYTHECMAIFFTGGRFKTNIECYQNDTASTDEHRSPNALGGPMHALGTADDDRMESKIWRYIPAPEITVNEQT